MAFENSVIQKYQTIQNFMAPYLGVIQRVQLSFDRRLRGASLIVNDQLDAL